MKEDLIEKAYEILESERSFSGLNDSEQELILKAFGTKEDYERMLQISGLALEEEEIIAPSMTTESQLLKEFGTKYNGANGEKKERVVFGIKQLFEHPVFRIAVPGLIVIIAFVWFFDFNDQAHSLSENNYKKELPKTENSSKKENNVTIQPKVIEKDLEENENFHSDDEDKSIVWGSFENSSNNGETFGAVNEIKDEKNTDKTYVEVDVEDSFRKSYRDDLSVESPNEELPESIEIEEDDYSIGYTDNIVEKDVFDVNQGTVAYTSEASSMDMEQSINLDSTINFNSNIFEFDNSAGNSVSPNQEMVGILSAKQGRLYNEVSKVGASQSNANNDVLLFEFLYTTY